MNRPLLIAFALLGLVTTAALAHAQLTRTPPVPAKRAYVCVEGRTANEVMEKANAMGENGWQLVAAAQGRSASIWCFEQFLAARPPER